ncbi:MAG TPA: SGNH/GDSL hydrolase family protein, partial [Candidatus Acidoferrales bacterium]|nr:SGNH/GDSL hydrolase family protein [Candidatus Acidoferrales bacterium]
VALEAVLRLAGVESRFGRLLSIRDVPTRNVDGVSIWSSSAPRFTAEDIQRASTNDPATFRILGLGDSIMYGVGQPKDKTYLEQARKNLAGRTRRSVEVLNLAVPGFNTKQEDLVYKELEGQIRPDLVLVHYWGDDGRQYRVVGGYVVDAADISEDGYLVIRALGLPPRVSDFF